FGEVPEEVAAGLDPPLVAPGGFLGSTFVDVAAAPPDIGRGATGWEPLRGCVESDGTPFPERARAPRGLDAPGAVVPCGGATTSSAGCVTTSGETAVDESTAPSPEVDSDSGASPPAGAGSPVEARGNPAVGS